MTVSSSKVGIGRIASVFAVASLALGAFAMTHNGIAAAKAAHGATTCTGAFHSPGVLSGVYPGNVYVHGICAVNAGPAVVKGNLILGPGGGLNAAFGRNDRTGSGSSSLTVEGNIRVRHNGTLILGCNPHSFPCFDDNPKHPTLTSPGSVGGNISSHGPLGVLVHSTSVGGNVWQKAGGGALGCKPMGVFAHSGSPVYSTYEDSSIDGNVKIQGYRSCWLGVARLNVGGNLKFRNNKFADPDAIEILSNTVWGNLSCRGNSAVWDNAETGRGVFPRAPEPNTVYGGRFGQCRLSTPTSKGGSSGPGPF